MTFHSDIRQFTVATFVAYLSTLPKPDWPGAGPIGTTAHNTYRPLAAQWVGKPSMLSMIATYKAKEWDRGPHLYFVVGAPNKAHDGIWMMTPLSMYGIHAGACNFERFGCELVGDFQNVPPSAALQDLFIEGTAALHRWAGLGPALNAHRDCMAGRTCPGNAMYAIMPQLQARLAAQMNPPKPTPPPSPLRTDILPGIGKTVHCSKATAQFYTMHGGLGFFGYPISDERATIGADGQACTILPCERAVLKTKPTEPAHQALLKEVFSEGWV